MPSSSPEPAPAPAPAPARAPAALHFAAGWLGGSIACVLLSPLEVVKTRLQSSQGGGRSALQVALLVARTEGVAGFYRGLVPHLLGVGPSRAFYFGTYSLSKSWGSQSFGLEGTPLHLAAAAIGSVVSSTVMSPVWVVKTRLQLQGAASAASAAAGATGAAAPSLGNFARAPAPAAAPPPERVYRGMADAFSRVYREEGIRAFYRGLGASYLGVAETALQFALYGSLKQAVTDARVAQLRQAHAKAEAAAAASTAAAAAAADASGGSSSAGAAAGLGGTRGERAGGARVGGAGSGAGSSAGAGAIVARPAPLPTDRAALHRLAYGDLEAFCTSAAAKLVAAVLTYPHEVLRTRMREQRSATPKYETLLGTFRQILRDEGARGLYGGLGVHMVRTVPNAAILLMVVERVVGGEV
jgi:hypothetical protein